MRPRGSFGPVGRALLDAAQTSPGQVRQLAARAQVSYAAARYTASRLVEAGALVVIDSGRPATLAPSSAAGPDEGPALAWLVLHRLPGLPVAAEHQAHAADHAEACVA